MRESMYASKNIYIDNVLRKLPARQETPLYPSAAALNGPFDCPVHHFRDDLVVRVLESESPGDLGVADRFMRTRGVMFDNNSCS